MPDFSSFCSPCHFGSVVMCLGTVHASMKKKGIVGFIGIWKFMTELACCTLHVSPLVHSSNYRNVSLLKST